MIARVLALVVALSVPVAAPGALDEWPQLGGTARHLGVNPHEHAFTPDNVDSPLAIAWKGHYGDNATSEAGVVVAGGFAYVAGFDGNLSAFAMDGCGAPSCEPQWQGHTKNGITGTPAVAGDVVLVGSADHFLYAFASGGCGGARLCPPLWKGRLQDAVVDSSPAVAGGIVYIGDYGGRLSAFALRGCGRAVCDPLWVGRGGRHEVLGAPAVADGTVFVGTARFSPQAFTGRLLAFPAGGCGAAECAPAWAADIGGPSTLTASPAVAGDTVFIGTTKLWAFAAGGCGASTCPPLRAYNLRGSGMETTPAVAGDLLIAASQATPDPNTIGVISVFPLAGCGAPVCDSLWTGVNFGAGFESPPVIAGGVVFVGKGPASGFPVDAGVFAFDLAGCGAETCLPLSLTQVGESQFYLGAPIAVADGKVLLASNDNEDGHSNVYALEVRA